MSGEPAGAPWRELVGVFVAAALVYLASPVRSSVSDSTYTLLLADRLLTHRSFDLREVTGRRAPPGRFPGVRRHDHPYQLAAWPADGRPPIRPGDRIRVYYFFPPGMPILSVPVAAAARLAGRPVVDPAAGGFLVERERRLQGWSAPIYAALFVAAAHAALRRGFGGSGAFGASGRRTALAATATLALASPLWTTVSRALWSHTGCLVLAGLALPLVVRLARGERAAGGDVAAGAGIGAALAAAYWARPVASILLATVGIWLLARHRRAAAGFALGAGLVLAAFLALNLATWKRPLPPYYEAGRIVGLPEPVALAGGLVSPSRGLLVFLPWLAVLVAAGVARWRRIEHRDLFVLGVGGTAALAAVVAAFPHWWGGYSYGPRLLTESVWFAVPIGVAVLPALEGDRRWRRALAAAALAGVAIHAGGALSRQGMLWNSLPRSVDEAPERIWDWRDPQWLAWANRVPRRNAPRRSAPPTATETPIEGDPR